MRLQRSGSMSLIAGVVLTVGSPALGYTYHVDDDSPGTGDGRAWANAFNDLQDALNAAEEYDMIKVAQGTYIPGTESTDSFVLVNGIKIYGGYIGYDAPDPDLRDIKAYETILSGNVQQGGSPTHHVVYASGVGNETLLDGFTIANGYANGSEPNDRGAGIYLSGSSLVVKNCEIRENFAIHGGGGVYVNAGGCAFVKCDFISNYCRERGGGVYFQSLFQTGVLKIINCGFRQNHSDYNMSGNGGAAFFDGGYRQITNSAFSGNTAEMSGGALALKPHPAFGSTTDLINCSLAGNHATNQSGGAIVVYNSGDVETANLTVQNCILWDNTKGLSGSVVPSQIEGGSAYTKVYDTVIEGGWSYTGAHISDEDPEFVDGDGEDDEYGTEDDNLRLKIGSPGIDWGDEEKVPCDKYDVDEDGHKCGEQGQPPAEPTPDLDLAERVVEADVDTGAYEFWCYADVDESGFVDVLDLLEVLAYWGSCDLPCPPYCDGDINDDCEVDVIDLLAVLSQWGCGLPPSEREPVPDSANACITRYGDDIEELIACIETIILTQGQ